MTHDRTNGMSRRQMLRRGAAVGGAVWAVPAVTAITLTPANAAAPSGPANESPKPGRRPSGTTTNAVSEHPKTGSGQDLTGLAVAGGALVAGGIVAARAYNRGKAGDATTEA